MIPYSYLLILLGTFFSVAGIAKGGWCFVLVWLGLNFFILGIAHAKRWHGVFGKRTDGSIPLWSRIAFLPLFVQIEVVWHVLRIFSREPASNEVNETLVVGRRPLGWEIEGEFVNFVDLTTEFAASAAVRRLPSYRCFPILDGSAPAPEALRDFLATLRPGRTFIHCAQGHGRTGLFAVAYLLNPKVAPDVESALQIIKDARPGICLNREQIVVAETYARMMA